MALGHIANKSERRSMSTLPTASVSTTQLGQLVTSGAINTKGSWAVLTESLPFQVGSVELTYGGSAASATRTDMLLDLAVGASGQEFVIFPNFLVGWRAGVATGMSTVTLPLTIPKGSRVCVRIASVIASDTLDVMAAFSSPLPGAPRFERAAAIGVGATAGTTHTPGSTNAYSTAANVGSALAHNYGAVLLAVGGTTATTTMTAISYYWDLQIGGVTLASWWTRGHTTEEVRGPFPTDPLPLWLPAGSQLQVRATASGTAQAYDVAFYGFY